MECGNLDLNTWLRNRKAVNPLERKFYWKNMLEAVQTIHKHGSFPAYTPSLFIIFWRLKFRICFVCRYCPQWLEASKLCHRECITEADWLWHCQQNPAWRHKYYEGFTGKIDATCALNVHVKSVHSDRSQEFSIINKWFFWSYWKNCCNNEYMGSHLLSGEKIDYLIKIRLEPWTTCLQKPSKTLRPSQEKPAQRFSYRSNLTFKVIILFTTLKFFFLVL